MLNNITKTLIKENVVFVYLLVLAVMLKTIYKTFSIAYNTSWLSILAAVIQNIRAPYLLLCPF